MTCLSKLVNAVLLVCVAFAGNGCQGRAAMPPPSDQAIADPPARSSEITLDSKMLTSIKVDTIGGSASNGQLAVAGKVQFDEDRVARVLAPLSGQVVDLQVKLGDSIRKGQTICVLSSRDAAAAAGEHIESRKDLELA